MTHPPEGLQEPALREALARIAALHGLGTVSGVDMRGPPNASWTAEEWERRILECVPSEVEAKCYRLADAILATLPQQAATDASWSDDISAAPAACHVLAARFDHDGGEWMLAVVSSPPSKPFTHWRMLDTPSAPTAQPPAAETRLREAVDAFLEWNEGPTEMKRPEVYQRKVRAIRAALTQPEPTAQQATELDANNEAMVCTGCGTTKTVEFIKENSPAAFTCCPEREMIPVRAALSFRQGEAVAWQWRAYEYGSPRTSWYPVGNGGDEEAWQELANDNPNITVKRRALYALSAQQAAGEAEACDDKLIAILDDVQRALAGGIYGRSMALSALRRHLPATPQPTETQRIEGQAFHIVWNEARNEGFITDDEQDALACLHGTNAGGGSTVGIAFADTYDDDELSMETVTLPASREHLAGDKA